jgi:hypothetical protein
MAAVVALLFGALEYWIAQSIGVATPLAVILASQVGVLAALLTWIGLPRRV